MSSALIADQLLNGLGYGPMLFLLVAGLTLVCGVMDTVNWRMAHCSPSASTAAPRSRSTATRSVAGAVMGTVLLALEVALMRRPQVFSVIFLLDVALAGLAGALSAVKTGQGLPMLAFLSRRASLH